MRAWGEGQRFTIGKAEQFIQKRYIKEEFMENNNGLIYRITFSLIIPFQKLIS